MNLLENQRFESDDLPHDIPFGNIRPKIDLLQDQGHDESLSNWLANAFSESVQRIYCDEKIK